MSVCVSNSWLDTAVPWSALEPLLGEGRREGSGCALEKTEEAAEGATCDWGCNGAWQEPRQARGLSAQRKGPFEKSLPGVWFGRA